MAISSVRLILIVAGTAAYLGVAVLGWGGFLAFFSHPALIVLALALFVLAGVALFAGGNLSPGVREDRGNRWVLVAFALIGLLRRCYCVRSSAPITTLTAHVRHG